MTETNKQREERELRELEGKNVQHYMVLLTAWINTKMEHDKTLITLSAAAIGLLITIITAKGIEKNWHIWLFLFAFIGYAVAIFTSLIIFQKNSVYIESELKKEDYHEHKLERLDKLALWSFIIGTVAFVSIGICSAHAKFKEESKKMNDKNNQVNQQGSLEEMKKSVQGLNNLRPIQSQNSLNPSSGNQSGANVQKNITGKGK